MKQKKKKVNLIKDALKAARKESREEEIKAHGKLILHTKVVQPKNKYNRRKNNETNTPED